MKFKSVYSPILNFILPNFCTFCGNNDRFSKIIQICKNCLPGNSDLIKQSKCMVCQTSIFGGECEYCNSRNIFFKKLEYLHVRDEFHKELINRIKFKDEPYLNNYFRLGLKKKWKQFNFPKFNYFCCIPSNRNTQKKRPISPISSIEFFLSNHLGLFKQEYLKKISKEVQSGKSFPERFFHARKSMTINEKFMGKIRGNVLLVDDIFTTGATMNEASRILIENGAEDVYLLALLRGE